MSPSDSIRIERLLAPWGGPHGGLPPFEQVQPTLFLPAFAAAIAAKRAEIAAIVGTSAAPGFDNTIAALEDSGRAMRRLNCLFQTFIRTMNTGPMRGVERELVPVLAAFEDEIVQNAALFARVKAVNDSDLASLSPEQRRLTSVIHDRMAHSGAALAGEAKARLTAINQRLAVLQTGFSQNLHGESEVQAIGLETAADLDGLPESVCDAAAAAASNRGLEGSWLITNSRSAVIPFLTYSSRRDLRQQVWCMSTMSGGNGDSYDNTSIIREIVRLRAERAKLLGFPSHAHWAVADQMAATPETAKALLMRVWEPAVARAREEIADMQALANEEGADFEIARWDRLYYSEKLRRARFQVDQAGVRQYLQMEKLREAMFWAAGELYQLDFAPAHHVPVYHPDVCVFEVSRSGQAVGLCWFDPFARPGKREGAWMTEYRTQENFRETILPMVSNNTNFIPGETGEPVLVSWEDAGAMFHEFGHALHGLSSNVSYPSLAGVQVARDLIELPSQINERWLSTAEVLTRFAIHHKTGEPMPAELINRIEKARNFDQGETVEYLAAAIYDLKIHMAEGDEAIDPVAMEQQVLTEIDIPPAMGMRHRPTHFSHIFSGSYAAGYYVYLWADVLAADVAEVFVRSPGGFYDHTTAERLLGKVLSVGNTILPHQAVRNFLGRDVDPGALLRSRGIAVSGS